VLHTWYAYSVAMSVRHGLLALLERGARYGYQLRSEFEHATGGTWPLNIGQVYTTLARLERDGMVRALPENDGGQRPYEVTAGGRAELALWFSTPVAQADRPRDELAIKLALALTTPGVDVRGVVQTQRTATMRQLQELTRLKGGGPDRQGGGPERPGGGPDRQGHGNKHSSSDPAGDLAWHLVLEAMVFQSEAEVRWLDHCESSLVRYASAVPAVPSVPTELSRPATRRTVKESSAR
jgi:DNA-binding PadR family transcriptional regulator